MDNGSTSKSAEPSPAASEIERGFSSSAAFSSADNAESLRSHLSRELEWLTEGIQIQSAGNIHRVHLGPYATRAEAEKVAERIRGARPQTDFRYALIPCRWCWAIHA